MHDTCIDSNTPIIPHRSKYYERNSSAQLINVPEVDSSYKYAGGGILSTTGDLVKFGNYMLDSYQNNLTSDQLHIKSETIKTLIWFPHSEIPCTDKEINDKFIDMDRIKTSYGFGWFLDKNKVLDRLECAYHTGGAVGASSCLLIAPSSVRTEGGIVVSVLCNTQNLKKIVKFTKSLAELFVNDL